MKARVIVFPIKGRNWCFSRSIDPSSSSSSSSSSQTPTTFKQLWHKIRSSSSSSSEASDKTGYAENVEVVVDFAANKMNKAWNVLENAPEGTIKSKLHGFGVKLLSRIKPSEIFLKSFPKDASKVEIIYPPSLHERLVRRRLRHIALRGTIIHKKTFYVSAIFLPFTSAFMILPLPNIPFFWVLFRTYSHWRALKGSEKLLELVSDGSVQPELTEEQVNDGKTNHKISSDSPWGFEPSEELEKLVKSKNGEDGVDKSTIEDICKRFNLNAMDVLKYRDTM